MQVNRIITTDNDLRGYDLNPQQFEDLSHIANCRIKELKDSNNNDLWLFPSQNKRYDDKIEKETFISIVGNKLTTGNILGFVGYGNTQLTIRSRFTNKAGHDWFMEYMLQKVFAINIFDLAHAKGNDEALNITAMMFPYFLQKALRQGVYKEYVRRDYNDSRVRGSIDFNAHIKNNFPFKNCKIAYHTRERVYDNNITQLIRHTIETLKANSIIWGLLCSNQETVANIRQIVNSTPSYKKSELSKIIHANSKPKIHPYYSEYAPLQKLCLQILKRKQTSYGDSSQNIYGVLFDGAWLWEEYLNLTLKKIGFKHPENKTKTDPIHPFKGKKRYPRFPDFMTHNVIADAKYKRVITLNKSQTQACDSIDRDDLHQMIAYMHMTSSNKGIFISPTDIDNIDSTSEDLYPDSSFAIKTEDIIAYSVGELDGLGGRIYVIGINIPQSASTYKEFVDAMKKIEKTLEQAMAHILSS